MRQRLLAVLALAAVAAWACLLPGCAGVPADFECEWRKAALDYAHHLQPQLNPTQQATLGASLAIAESCGGNPTPQPLHAELPRGRQDQSAPATATTLVVASTDSPGQCSDSNPGTEAAPLCTVAAALHKISTGGGGGAGAEVLLRGGAHRLRQSLVLEAAHAGLTLRSFPGEAAVLTGALALSELASGGFSLARAGPGSLHVWKVVLDKLAAAAPGIDALLFQKQRAILARFPNANPETDPFPTGYITAATSWTPPRQGPPPAFVDDPSHNRTDYVSMFQTWRGGVGGSCAAFSPPFSYWCSNATQGGGASMYVVPSGLAYDQTLLPHSPYKSLADARVVAWRPGHWANWGFEVAADTSNSSHLVFSRGGFQGARGNSRGAEWYIEGVEEELDANLEFFFDRSSKTLYFATDSATAPAVGDLEVPQLKTLVQSSGTQTAPVRDVTLAELTFTGTQPTFLDAHGVPSGGDWALQRSAALFFEDTEDLTVANSLFIRLDGNALMLSGYNRRANISGNEFAYTGDSAIALWGYTRPLPGSALEKTLPFGVGIDGTGGDQPRFTVVRNNFIHHLGIHEKQSSCYFHAKSAQSHLEGNICFQIPRAGFNLNDGFGGGHNITRNLLFNTCNESSDHGAINTWDRQPFLTDVRTGSPSLVPAETSITQNFIVSNNEADGGAVDNDDGSSYYSEQRNFYVYGGFKAGNFEGHSKVSASNVMLFPHVYGNGPCFWNWPGGFPQRAHEEQFHDNFCVLDDGEPYLKLPGSCDFANPASIVTAQHNNTVMCPTANCGGVSGCGGKTIPFSEWTKLGLDTASRLIVATPSSSQLVDMGRKLLGF